MPKKTQKNGRPAVKNNEVRIIVAGGTAVGKSAILQLIGKALAEKGFPFEVSTQFGENPIVCDEYQMKRIGAIKGKRKTKVVLEERHTYHAIDTTDFKSMIIHGVK